MGIGSHKIRNGSARFVIGGVLAIQRSVVPVGVLVNISPPIIRQFQRFRKNNGAPVVDHHKGRDLTRDAPALVIMPNIVGRQTIRNGISLDSGFERSRLHDAALADDSFGESRIRYFCPAGRRSQRIPDEHFSPRLSSLVTYVISDSIFFANFP